VANFLTHLAVAKRYIEINGEVDNIQDFYDGSVLPDLTDDKEKTHYGTRTEMTSLLKRNIEKVNPEKFLQHNKLDNDINRGKYLHMRVDWEYYNNFISPDHQAKTNFETFFKDVVYTDNLCADYIMKKYGVYFGLTSAAIEKEITELKKQWKNGDISRWGKNFVGEMLYSKKELDAFIEKMARVKLPR